MLRRCCLVVIWGIIWMAGCGPDKILVRPELDTPAQHIANGEVFLETGKFSDAFREFQRAKELDPSSVSARVGMALSAGHSGDVETGLKFLSEAEPFAATAEDRATLKQGYDRLNALKPRTGVAQ